MTGWRLGYAAGPASLIRAMARMQAQCSLNPSSVSQAAAVAALNGPQDFVAERCAEFETRRNVVVPLIDAIPGLSCTRPHGAFYVYVSCAGWIGLVTPHGQRLANDEDVTTLSARVRRRGAEWRRLRPVAVFSVVVRDVDGEPRRSVSSDGRRQGARSRMGAVACARDVESA